MSLYRFQHFKLAPGDPWWQQIAHQAYVSRQPLFCACVSPGIEAPMVLVQAHGTYVAKPIPLTGPRHASSCDHYRQPDALSGRSEIAGAIREDVQANKTYLSLDISLRERASGAAPSPFDDAADMVEGEPEKLTLKALLHYLFDEAGLTRWTPKMHGKRIWGSVSRALCNAAANKIAKRQPLLDNLYIPEPFFPDQANRIRQRRAKKLRRLKEPDSRMLIISEWRCLESTHLGSMLKRARDPTCC
jgi:Protein of unknown function (DUF1173)